ncbi:MAG TPA: type II toxin-antitoxin system VapC family toxin [Phycisphaerae bacterium]|nr:type II toxin-antitoxin system VapC family toxin [Phycisphaerae bacterium]
MKPKVYVETTIFSVLVARPTNNLLDAARQQTTRIWWQNDADHFDLFTSEAVRMEALVGDPEMARQRLEYIASLPRLSATDDAQQLSQEILSRRWLPARAKVDALHLAIAAVHRMDFLLTWNCKHLANPMISRQISRHLAHLGYNPPFVCTPLGFSGATT